MPVFSPADEPADEAKIAEESRRERDHAAELDEMEEEAAEQDGVPRSQLPFKSPPDGTHHLD